jgi:hypothetical protein
VLPAPRAPARAAVGPRARGALLVLACAALAAATLPLSPVPGFDPLGWMLWGREILSPSLAFSTAGYPSWKPLPGLLGIPFALVGDAAPALWLVVARAGALLAVAAAFRLGARLAGPWAGLLAAAGLLLAPDWWSEAAAGGSDELLTALLLWGLERHLARRPWAGFALVFAAALLRPEAWPLLALSAALVWRARARRRALAPALMPLVPALWFGIDWLGSGSPTTGGELARRSAEVDVTQAAGWPPLVVLGHLAGSLLPVLALGVAVAVGAAVARAERGPLLLAALALTWTATIAGMTLLGYAGIPRFLFPATALLCVLGGAGLVGLGRLAGGGRRGIALVALLLAAGTPLALPAAVEVRRELRGAERHAAAMRGLDRALAAAGGPSRVRACGTLAVSQPESTLLAWRLHMQPRDLLVPRAPGLAFVRAGRPFPGLTALYERGTPLHLVARARAWDVVAVGMPPAPCPVRPG